MRCEPDYGIDGPVALCVLVIAGVVLLTASACALTFWPAVALNPPMILAALIGADLLVAALGLALYSYRGKRHVQVRLRELAALRGCESVLDVGCGRGLLLVAAARDLPSGRATGVDIWRSDVSGNSREAALENARRAGVAPRVEIRDADARRLPFADETFDVVVSAMALHNLRATADRQTAVRELVRVLKPGGRVVLMDLRHTAGYEKTLCESGFKNVRRFPVWRWLSLLFAIVTAGAARFMWVTGTKPEAADDGPVAVAMQPAQGSARPARA
jgi:ubiquinone/menaquinone biosynthesis C-methylase UbiE